jgi:glycosyltransferase involved in cell wall biosynthesis
VIHNGIDIKTFSPYPSQIYQDLGISISKKVVLGVAALWDARKGLGDFIQLSKILPNDEYAIVIVGKLQNAINLIEGGCQMVFVERTQNVRELAQLYSGASVFVNPTYQDNYPTTNLEALACGTPVITYRTGGSPESVDGKTGIVIETGDVEALAEAIVDLKSHPLSREDCRARAEKHFDNAKCFDKYFQLYESLMK